MLIQQNLVDDQSTRDVPNSDEVVAVGEGTLGGIEDPPDFDGISISEIHVNSSVRNLQETQKDLTA